MNPRIMSLGYAIPDGPNNLVLTQKEALKHWGYTTPLAARFASYMGVSGHRFWFDPVGKSVQQLSEGYIEGAAVLSLRAIQQCMDEAAYRLDQLGALIFCSTTQQLEVCPAMTFRLAIELGLPQEVKLIDIVGDGCQGAIPGLETAYAFALAFDKPVLLVCTEICSATYFPAPESDIGNTLANLLFSDASSAALISPPRGAFIRPPPVYRELPFDYPEILGFCNRYTKEGLNLLGYVHQDGRMKVVLSPDVPKKVPPMVAGAVRELLAAHNLKVSDVSSWCLHNGGVALLNEIAKLLGLDSKRDFRYSWEVLDEIGNASAATIGIVAKKLHADPANRHGYMVAAAMGAGAGVGTALLRYG